MNQKYLDWISNYQGDIFRRCKEVSEEMQTAFPELRIAKGLVQILENNKWYQHQWLVDDHDNIIDPTAKQWIGILQYDEIRLGEQEPHHRCANCGEWVFSKIAYCCSPKCEQEYLRYVTTGVL